MCKKLTIAVAAVVLGLLVLGGTQIGPKIPGYVALWWNKADTALSQQVPLDMEIERIAAEVKKIDEDIKTARSNQYKTEIALERMENELKLAKAGLDKEEAALAVVFKQLDSGTKVVTYEGREFPAEQVRTEFARRYEAFEAAQNEYKAKKSQLDHKKQLLLTSKQTIDTMKTQKAEMEAKVTELRVELEAAREAQAKSAAPTDNSRIATLKADIGNVEDQIKLLRKEAEAQGSFVNTVADDLKTKDSFDRAKAHFEKKSEVVANP
jgi:predicted  nucleic acid-binding Zn-ribbon protein